MNLFQKRYKVYESIDFLPIWNFKQVEKTGDLRYLIKNIDYEHLPKANLNKETWNKIRTDYIEESLGDEFGVHAMAVLNIYNYRYRRLFLLNAIVELSIKRDQDIIGIIRSLGYKFDDSTDDNYYNSLIDLQRQLTGVERQINLKTSELNKKSENKGEEQSLEETLIHLSRFNGINFDSKTLTCKKFILLIKDFKKLNKPKEQWPTVK